MRHVLFCPVSLRLKDRSPVTDLAATLFTPETYHFWVNYFFKKHNNMLKEVEINKKRFLGFVVGTSDRVAADVPTVLEGT